jgi:hypothetical protein
VPVKPRTEVDIGAGALRESGAGGLGESEPEIGAGSQGDRGIITAGARACAVVTMVLAGFALCRRPRRGRRIRPSAVAVVAIVRTAS